MTPPGQQTKQHKDTGETQEGTRGKKVILTVHSTTIAVGPCKRPNKKLRPMVLLYKVVKRMGYSDVSCSD